MEAISGYNGHVVYSQCSYMGEGSNSVLQFRLEGSSRQYSLEQAEQPRSASILSVDQDGAVSLAPTVVSSPDGLFLRTGQYAVAIDKSKCTVTVRDCASDRVLHHIVVKGAEKILSSDTVGNVDLDPEMKRLLFIAAAKPAKAGDASGASYDQAKFKFKESLGERLGDVQGTILFSLCLTTGVLSTVDTRSILVLKALSTAKGIVILGLDTDKQARMHGLVYCSNRATSLYLLSGELEPRVVCASMACRSPLLSSTRDRLAYLGNALGGPHMQYSRLVVVDLTTMEQRVVREDLMVGSVFGANLIEHDWSDCIIFNVQDGCYCRIVKVDIGSGALEYLSEAKASYRAMLAMNCKHQVVVAQKSTLLTPPVTAVYRVGRWSEPSPASRFEAPGTVSVFKLHEYCEYIYCRPSKPLKGSPVILFPHGGPISAYIDDYVHAPAVLVSAGYAVARVNFTGSTGYGQGSIDKLIKEHGVGITDVADCVLVVEDLMKKGHPVPYFMGGSHGGYIGACLSSQRPDLVKKCVLINPVISLYASSITSDIADYFFENLGLPCPPTRFRQPDKEELLLMFERSPRPSPANPPTLLLLGAKDMRVPPSNGIAWYGWLRDHGVDAKCLLFPTSNHAIEEPEPDRDLLLAVLDFLGS